MEHGATQTKDEVKKVSELLTGVLDSQKRLFSSPAGNPAGGVHRVKVDKPWIDQVKELGLTLEAKLKELIEQVWRMENDISDRENRLAEAQAQLSEDTRRVEDLVEAAKAEAAEIVAKAKAKAKADTQVGEQVASAPPQ